jgi:hypothetical protein
VSCANRIPLPELRDASGVNRIRKGLRREAKGEANEAKGRADEVNGGDRYLPLTMWKVSGRCQMTHQLP